MTPLLQGSYTPLTKNCTLGLQKLLLNLSVCIEYAVFLEKGPTFTISAVIQLWINLHQLRSFHLKDIQNSSNHAKAILTISMNIYIYIMPYFINIMICIGMDEKGHFKLCSPLLFKYIITSNLSF